MRSSPSTTIAVVDTMDNSLTWYPWIMIDHLGTSSRPSSTATAGSSAAIAFARAHRTSQANSFASFATSELRAAAAPNCVSLSENI